MEIDTLFWRAPKPTHRIQSWSACDGFFFLDLSNHLSNINLYQCKTLSKLNMGTVNEDLMLSPRLQHRL
jgi:hypothetical protein